jgi:hypothetical protein
VHIPIHLHNNGLFRIVKIHNIRANAMLSAEFQGMALPGSQSSPKPIFSRRHLGAQTTSQTPLLGISLKNSVHRDLPHLPSPYKGEEALSAKWFAPSILAGPRFMRFSGQAAPPIHPLDEVKTQIFG